MPRRPNSVPRMTDSHAHLEFPGFDRDRRAVLERARAAGVHRVMTMGTLDGEGSLERTAALMEEVHPGGRDHDYPGMPQLWTTVGCHPHDARHFDALGGEAALRDGADRPRLLAIGEIGLDYHYDMSPRPVQRDVFRRQIRVARELGLPVVVHLREAGEDFLRIADEEGLAEIGAVMHCFTGAPDLAEAALERGFLLSFSGILTFRNAPEVRASASLAPLSRLLVETDSPFLAPVPHRGRRAEPAMVVNTARRLAGIQRVSEAELEAATDRTFERFFLARREEGAAGGRSGPPPVR